jgi:outer membrane protein W
MLCLTATPVAVFAQEAPAKKETITAPKFEIGLQTGAYRSFETDIFSRPGRSISVGNSTNLSTGVFGRYYFGKHWAVEAGVNVSRSNTNRLGGPAYFDSTTMGTFTHRANMSAYEIPVQVQYHFLSKESRIRPYVGLGGSAVMRDYTVASKIVDGAGTPLYDSEFDNNSRSFALKFTQGLTWQINKNWQFNQSIFIQREMMDRRTNVGLQLGIGYTIR